MKRNKYKNRNIINVQPFTDIINKNLITLHYVTHKDIPISILGILVYRILECFARMNYLSLKS